MIGGASVPSLPLQRSRVRPLSHKFTTTSTVGLNIPLQYVASSNRVRNNLLLMSTGGGLVACRSRHTTHVSLLAETSVVTWLVFRAELTRVVTWFMLFGESFLM
jgi:hypothetical protein